MKTGASTAVRRDAGLGKPDEAMDCHARLHKLELLRLPCCRCSGSHSRPHPQQGRWADARHVTEVGLVLEPGLAFGHCCRCTSPVTDLTAQLARPVWPTYILRVCYLACVAAPRVFNLMQHVAGWLTREVIFQITLHVVDDLNAPRGGSAVNVFQFFLQKSATTCMLHSHVPIY
jgi:hypothetical protein